MAKQLQLRRGTTAQHASFTGAVGEVTIDSTKDTAVVHDASQSGGYPLLREDLNNLATGAVAVGKLSTNSGSYGQTLQVNNAGTAMEMGESGLIGCQVFNSSGTYTKTAGTTHIRVQLVGAGGGGSGHGESGGAGGYSEKVINARSITTVSVTIGSGGNGTTYSGQGTNGGTSSFGSYLSATGGHGANKQGSHSGGVGGVGSGGTINLYGGGGGGHTSQSSSPGPGSYFGGGAHSAHTNQASFPAGHESHAAPGCGGPGAYTTHTRGANGKTGIVIVWEYA
tara:strand:+ start:4749 stop:5591 length:843 start_codon:yes stop_codon:yes gene_type:complete